ncbi:hypothetical protein WR25_06487 [Diploscapter pachys]|uniref:Mitochondrial inner membrane protein Mpv17 n=1 Tax=Diploscapter pachys TaxID=2018661 RepID=A0A2A2J317_9BILA|nr:hypothetical protein WR25_06487 [Diploscapter pachys]
MLLRAVRAYNNALQRRPLAVQMISAGIISGGGDVFAQFVLEKGKKSYDPWRTARFFSLAAFFVAPAVSTWFRVLERVHSVNPKLTPLKRVIIDQSTFGPCFNAVFLFILRMTEGNSVENAAKKVKNEWPTIWMNSLKLWPAVQLFNFYLAPLNYRVIIVQAVAFFWNSYISYATQNAPKII